MTDVLAKLVPAASVLCPLVAAQTVTAPLVELAASVTAPLIPARSVVCPLIPAQAVNPTGMPDAEWNWIVFVVDDAGREYYDYLEQTSYNPASPGARVDPVSPSWCANRWAEVDQDESTFPYPPTPVLRDLAVNGLVLTRMNVAAMCSPTRASLMTGRHNVDHSLGNAIQGNSGVNETRYEGTTLYNRMDAVGSNYSRLHIGKWHIGYSYSLTIPGFTETGYDNTVAAFRDPVDRGGATYYFGGLMNFGQVVPGVLETQQDHTSYVVATHDARDHSLGVLGSLHPPDDGFYELGPEGGFNIQATNFNGIIAETEAARKALLHASLDRKPFLMTVMYHAVHDPTGWEDIGGEALSAYGYHSYGTANPGGNRPGHQRDETTVAASHPGIVKAFVESVDTSMGLILDALTSAQRARTMVVFVTDNGSTADMLTETASPAEGWQDVLEAPKPTVPASSYNPSHSKRSPWQGGIGAACVINGPGVVNPGGGTIPRFWGGLCGVEDIHAMLMHGTGTPFVSDENYYTQVLQNALKGTSPTGRQVYIQRAFQNGYHEDPWSTDQGGQIRFLSAQNAAGWKLLWIRAGAELEPTTSPPTPASIASSQLATWLWQLYDMPNDPGEATDLFYDSGSFADPTDYEAHTVQDRYDALTSGQKAQFSQLYLAIEAEGLIPPGMAVSL